MKKIIFNADDFGPSDFINNGIREGIAAGLISSVSTFVTFGQKNIDNIIQLKKDFGDKVKIGLHFTINAGEPTLIPPENVSSLRGKVKGTNQYKFWRLPYLKINNIDLWELEEELKSQVKILADILGGIEHVNHINSHTGILSMHQPFWKVAVDFARRNNIPLRSPSAFEYDNRYLTDRAPFLPVTRQAIFKGIKVLFKGNGSTFRALISGAGPRAKKKRTKEAEKQGVQMPSCYLMSYYRQPSQGIIEWVIDHAKDGETIEFLLHPGRGDYSNDNDWGIAPKSLTKREAELDVLLNSGLPDLLAAKQVKMTHYRDL